jgi:hypothetical protein
MQNAELRIYLMQNDVDFFIWTRDDEGIVPYIYFYPQFCILHFAFCILHSALAEDIKHCIYNPQCRSSD